MVEMVNVLSQTDHSEEKAIPQLYKQRASKVVFKNHATF